MVAASPVRARPKFIPYFGGGSSLPRRLARSSLSDSFIPYSKPVPERDMEQSPRFQPWVWFIIHAHPEWVLEQRGTYRPRQAGVHCFQHPVRVRTPWVTLPMAEAMGCVPWPFQGHYRSRPSPDRHCRRYTCIRIITVSSLTLPDSVVVTGLVIKRLRHTQFSKTELELDPVTAPRPLRPLQRERVHHA